MRISPGSIVRLVKTSLRNIGLVSGTTTVGMLDFNDYAMVIAVRYPFNVDLLQNERGQYDVLVLSNRGVLGWIYMRHLRNVQLSTNQRPVDVDKFKPTDVG